MCCSAIIRTVTKDSQWHRRAISWKASLIVGGTDPRTRNFTSSSTYSIDQKTFSTQGEKKIFDVLVEKFPKAEEVEVKDISGGCGSMYEIYITSSEFSGKRTVLQHRMVNDALAEEVKEMHGLRIFTSLPS